MELYSLWCEYDYGQEGLVFSSIPDAKYFLKEQIEYQGDDWTSEELWEDGLAGVNEVIIYARD